MNKKVQVFAGLEELSAAAAGQFIRLAEASIAERGRFDVALTGGSTPRRMYEYLANARYAEQVAWPSVHIYFGDERCVPPHHPDSNFGMAYEALLRHVPLPSAQIQRMHGEEDPTEAATAYARLLDAQLPKSPRGMPQFDLVLLGLGADGHIASLFPGTEGLAERSRCAVANYVPQLQAWRLSLTLPVIASGRQILLLVSGEPKASIVSKILADNDESPPLPAQMLESAATLEWYLDSAAASTLPGENKR